MKNFWPNRSVAKGFSIENIARKYREKISSTSSNEISNQLLDNRKLESNNKDMKYNLISNLSFKRGHWANRDFSEYRDIA